MKKIKIASAAIINSKKELLLVRKKNSTFFQLAGGKINENETKLETVIREIHEEIGLIVTENQLKFLGEHQTKAVNELDTTVQGSLFLIILEADFKPEIANEIEEYAWLNHSNYENYKWAHLAKEFILPIWLKL